MKTQRLGTLLFGALLALAGCGGGTGGTGMTGNAAVSIGVMTKGSIIVNGVRFEDTTANIVIDDTPKTAANLQTGMVVKVRGRINEDRVTGTAERVEVENEVRGTVQTTNPSAVPPSFTVIGQTVLVDDQTVFANFASAPASPSAAVAALVANTTVVEVHGQRDATGNVRASRVEIVAAPGANIDELRGIISGLVGTTFTLNGVTVDAASAQITPAGATLNNGNPVEVHGSFNGATFIAVRVDREDMEDAQFQPGADDEFEVEGFVTGFTSLSATFLVNGQTVQLAANVRFENGTSLDLADNVKVEAEGKLNGTTLVADKISFKRSRVILTGVATVTGSIPGTGTLQVFGKTVQINDLTEITSTAGIADGERVEVRAFVDAAGNIVAERVRDNADNKDLLQARVTAKNGNILTLLGISADLSGATQFQDENGQAIGGGLAAFLAAVTPASATSPGSLVKLKGTFNAGTLAVEEAEIED